MGLATMNFRLETHFILVSGWCALLCMLQSLSCFNKWLVFRISCEHLIDRIIKIFSIEYFLITKQHSVQMEMLMNRSISTIFSILLKNNSKKGNVSSYTQFLSDRKEYTQVLTCSVIVLIVNVVRWFRGHHFKPELLEKNACSSNSWREKLKELMRRVHRVLSQENLKSKNFQNHI